MFGTMNAWLEAVRFVNDSQRVIALRLIRLASGGTLAADEARRMVAEENVCSWRSPGRGGNGLGKRARGACGPERERPIPPPRACKSAPARRLKRDCYTLTQRLPVYSGPRSKRFLYFLYEFSD